MRWLSGCGASAVRSYTTAPSPSAQKTEMDTKATAEDRPRSLGRLTEGISGGDGPVCGRGPRLFG